MRVARSLLLALAWVAGCGGGGALAPDATAEAGLPGPDGGVDASGPDADAGPRSEGGVPRDDEPPVTSRPSRGFYQCRVQRDRTDHKPRSWSIFPPALVKTVGGAAFLARFESTLPSLPPSPIDPPPAQLLVSTFDVTGTFGAPVTIPVVNARDSVSVAAAPRGDGFVVTWVESGTLSLAAFDAGGKIVLGPKEVIPKVGPGGDPHLAAGAELRLAAGPDGGFGLIYTPQVRQGSYEVRFAVLEPDGGLRLAPRALTPMPGSTFAAPAPAIVATAGGYAMVWRDPGDSAGAIDFAAADARGAEVVARHRISPPAAPGLEVGGAASFAAPTNALIASGDGFVAAWTEGRRGDPFEASSAGSVVRLARLDAIGNRVGAPVSLRPYQADVDEVEPSLIPFGDALAVLWGHGSHIYLCGGCVPDHRIDLMLIDPATLTPVSDVVSLTNGGDPRAGGLLRRRVAALGDSLLVTYLLTFHTYAVPGSAAFSCTKN